MSKMSYCNPEGKEQKNMISKDILWIPCKNSTLKTMQEKFDSFQINLRKI